MQLRNKNSKRGVSITWVLIITLIVIYLTWSYASISNTKVIYEREQVILDNLTKKINEAKGQLVQEIRQCESSGYSEDYGLITYDPHSTNKKVEPPSIGLFQFKVTTVQHYYKVLYQKEITRKEAVLIALDEQKSSQLASDIIFNTENGLSNWYLCSKKLDSHAKLKTIKFLSE